MKEAQARFEHFLLRKNAVGRGACPAELDAALGGGSPQLPLSSLLNERCHAWWVAQ